MVVSLELFHQELLSLMVYSMIAGTTALQDFGLNNLYTCTCLPRQSAEDCRHLHARVDLHYSLKPHDCSQLSGPFLRVLCDGNGRPI